ncbi:MAG: hypothetical protein R3E53_08365 [Myxococcota bacterium]
MFKTNVIRPNGPWRIVDEVEFATLGSVDWFNHPRLLAPIGKIPPRHSKSCTKKTRRARPWGQYQRNGSPSNK